MTKKLHISFILDETGSMNDVKGQTIAGFNEYIDNLKKGEASSKALFTLTKFNSEKVEIVCDDVSLACVNKLTNENYNPDHMTPLYDAVGKTIKSLESKMKGKKQHALVIIQTDGQENASREYTRQNIFSMIEDKKKLGWTFAFLGADQDAYLASVLIGISKGNTMCYAKSGGKPTEDLFSQNEDNL
ncbi:MAG: VWA domain-containing protein [Candidatus Helarchaeota archaeon]|nr:VWA domain-containing protein [Candidatus Helarchaeota archaeon]